MEFPVPFGEWLEMSEGTFNKKVYRLRVTEAIRGEEAWRRIYDANMFNSEPPEDKEYVLLWVEVEYPEGSSEDAFHIHDYEFKSVSNGQILDQPVLGTVNPDPQLDLSLLPGASGAGWISVFVFKDDPDPLLALGLSGSGRYGTFFATHE